MAEFQEVIKQYKRMCDNNDCCNCPFFDTTDLSYYKFNNSCNSLVLARPEVYEPLIMQWAAEHPEPVYPTWGEFFVSIKALYEKWDVNVNSYDIAKYAVKIFKKPIPADIAQKLGVEPKEEPCSE